MSFELNIFLSAQNCEEVKTTQHTSCCIYEDDDAVDCKWQNSNFAARKIINFVNFSSVLLTLMLENCKSKDFSFFLESPQLFLIRGDYKLHTKSVLIALKMMKEKRNYTIYTRGFIITHKKRVKQK